MGRPYSFTVISNDLIIKFSCANHKKRIIQFLQNLAINRSESLSNPKILTKYETLDDNITFSFDGLELKSNEKVIYQAVFFENTEYPLIVRGNQIKLSTIELYIANHKKSDTDKDSSIISDNGELYGSLNFHNQVGETDFCFRYQIAGETNFKEVSFSTEVLSYKLDYRSDLKTIISDIENEYALLSSAFLKDTYLSFREGLGENTELVWFQIFKSCYKEIIRNAKIIINRPKRRLHTISKYERGERLLMLPRELENEYQFHKDNPAHLYRIEDLTSSHDTIENRFLKYVINELHRKFIKIRTHIIMSLRLNDPNKIDVNLDDIDSELLLLINNSFFKGIGQFKGFAQDNLVMKKAIGYKEILHYWIILQQGFELEEGIRKLEVKDISDLYEIWCFIKIKNIVAELFNKKYKNIKSTNKGKIISNEFIPQLIYGGSVSFIKDNGIELASVSYNAEIQQFDSKENSAIEGTDSLTTKQRPDIVLRLSKENDEIKYTYLFDAKYRINESKINGLDVPPEDAIDQIHRYRDAIYYTNDGKDSLKKEIIAGYVLFPGNVPDEFIKNGTYYYQKSNKRIGIGAFPIKPSNQIRDKHGAVIVDPNSSEQSLKEQIDKWLKDDESRKTLLETSIPQKGLKYENDLVNSTSLLTYYHLENYPNCEIIIACYYDQSHLDWILGNNDRGTLIYNILLNNDRYGNQRKNRLKEKKVKFAILYEINHEHENKYIVLRVAHNAFIPKNRMIKTKYPYQPLGDYFCYVFDEEVNIGRIDLNLLISNFRISNRDYIEGDPIFIRCTDVMPFRNI